MADAPDTTDDKKPPTWWDTTQEYLGKGWDFVKSNRWLVGGLAVGSMISEYLGGGFWGTIVGTLIGGIVGICIDAENGIFGGMFMSPLEKAVTKNVREKLINLEKGTIDEPAVKKDIAAYLEQHANDSPAQKEALTNTLNEQTAKLEAKRGTIVNDLKLNKGTTDVVADINIFSEEVKRIVGQGTTVEDGIIPTPDPTKVTLDSATRASQSIGK